MNRLAILASGSGTNAQKLVEHFRQHASAEVVLIACDNPQAGVLQRAWDLSVPTYLFTHARLKSGAVLHELQSLHVDLVILAGFLRLVPLEMVTAYRDRIINIHPSLLPDFGGKGMYGDRVHQAVLAAKKTESGITIHYVNERFDEGAHIAQYRCPVLPSDTVETLAARVHALEHAHFARTIESILPG